MHAAFRLIVVASNILVLLFVGASLWSLDADNSPGWASLVAGIAVAAAGAAAWMCLRILDAKDEARGRKEGRIPVS